MSGALKALAWLAGVAAVVALCIHVPWLGWGVFLVLLTVAG